MSWWSIVVMLLSTPVLSLAQSDAADPLDPGREAFRQERFEDAARVFERVASEDPANAEAHFLVARVYFETPVKDLRKARKAIERAIELEPENLEFLVAQLLQYREDSPTFLGDRIREARRLETSRVILKIDPDNAYAHEELGLLNIREFWEYRNAIMMPGLNYGYAGEQRYVPSIAGDAVNPNNLPLDELLTEQQENQLPQVETGTSVDVNQVFLGDKFDIETLRAQGVDVQHLGKRAERAYGRAILHLNKSLEVDPRRRVVYDRMMEVFALKGEYEDALEMLYVMYSFFPEDPDLWRYFGLTYYKLGNMVEADRSFSTAFEFMDEDEQWAYENLDLFLTNEEVKLRDDDPVAFNARYWTSQDPRYLTTYNERKLEHYYRLTYADLLYSSRPLGLRGWETERGQIMIRYGPPPSDVILRPSVDGIFNARTLLVGAMLETISGTNEDGVDTETRGLENTSSFGVLQSTAAQAFEENNSYNIWDYGNFRFVFEDPFKNGEFRMYSPPADQTFQEIGSWQNDYIMLSEETIERTPELYEYEAPGRQIEIPYLTTAFRGEGGETDLYVHYGIPLNDYDRDKNFVEITANTGTFLINEHRDILVERRRTIYGLPTTQVVEFEEQELWVDSQLMTSPPGEHEISVEFATISGQTVAVQRREVSVPDYSSGALGLSDIMLAYSVEETIDGEPLSPNEVLRGNYSIRPAPWSVYGAQWPIYIYFEIYNLDQGVGDNTDYSVEISLTPKEIRSGVGRVLGNIFGRRADGVSVSYEGSGPESMQRLYQILDVASQEMGLYTLTLEVIDNLTGERVSRTQDLFLETGN